MNITDAEHEETSPDANQLLISKLTCSLVGETQTVKLKKGTLAYQVYGQEQIIEQFSCNYGLNRIYEDDLQKNGLRITGRGEDGEARIVELADCPFFVATLFVPQLSSSEGQPHPLIMQFLLAAQTFQRTRVVP